MTRRKRWSIYGGIACIVVAAQLIFLSNIVSPYPDVQQPPEEANRVVHPAGFSIVKPDRTHAIVDAASSVGDDSINILPATGRSRYTPILHVRRFREPADPSRLERDGFKEGTFQGQPAFVYRGPSGKYDAYRIVITRGSEWYEVALLIPRGDDVAESLPSPEWQRYLETFSTVATPKTSQPSDHTE